MPALSDPKHEMFANLIFNGAKVGQAYVDSGYAPHASSASRLRSSAKVRARIDELQARQQIRHDVTVDTITKELDEAAKDAAKDSGHAARVAAIMGKAKLHGLIIDKQKVEQGRLDNMDDDALAEHIEGRLAALASGGVEGVSEGSRGTGTPSEREPDPALSPVSEADGIPREGQDA